MAFSWSKATSKGSDEFRLYISIFRFIQGHTSGQYELWEPSVSFCCCLLGGDELTAQLAAEAAAVVATRLLSLEHWKVLEAQYRTGTELMLPMSHHNSEQCTFQK